MPPRKRKVKELGGVEGEEPRRSSRRKAAVKDEPVAVASEQSRPVERKEPRKKGTKKEETKKETKDGTKGVEHEVDSTTLSCPRSGSKPQPKLESVSPLSTTKRTTTTTNTSSPTGRQYWLMKAEPESRLENGHDISFSIDDLAAKTVPEPWDGIRNYGARNNLRAMKKGDLAFFYHSSCKVPAIVGIMEVVEEHSPDLSAHDPKKPYYDASSTPASPKWSVVHVSFRQKLRVPITLKELKAWYAEGKEHPLAQMQMLRMGRMSVSRVSEGEWEFLVEEMRKRGDVLLV